MSDTPDFLGEVRNARLADEPIVQPVFLIASAVMLLASGRMVHRAWWRMPPDPRPAKRRRGDQEDG